MAGEWDGDDLPGVLARLAAHVDELVPAPLHRLRSLWVPSRPDGDRNTPTGRGRTSTATTTCRTSCSPPSSTRPSPTPPRCSPPSRPLRVPDGRPAPQDRPAPGPRPGRRGHTAPGDRHRLGRTRPAGRGPGRAGHHPHPLLRAGRPRTRARVREASLADRVDIQLRDYRDVEGRYDAVVSVEMIEAVGAEYWHSYFRTLRGALAPGGRVALQAITMGHLRMLHTAATHTWISKYVFPGGLIPPARPSTRTPPPPGCAPSPTTATARTTRRPCACGGSGSPPGGTTSPPSASTPSSGACGSCTSPIRKPASAPATSTSARSS